MSLHDLHKLNPDYKEKEMGYVPPSIHPKSSINWKKVGIVVWKTIGILLTLTLFGMCVAPLFRG